MSLEDRLNEEPAEAWVPKPGDSLLGIITGVGSRDGGYGQYFIWTITTKDGTRAAVHAFHSVLVNEMAKYKLREGSEIGIKYLGKPAGKNYEMYRVVSDAEVNMSEPEAGPVPSDVPSNGFEPVNTPVTASAADDPIPF